MLKARFDMRPGNATSLRGISTTTPAEPGIGAIHSSPGSGIPEGSGLLLRDSTRALTLAPSRQSRRDEVALAVPNLCNSLGNRSLSNHAAFSGCRRAGAY